MKNNKSISILIPARNAEAYLAECLDSVCKQLECEDEIIIVNNESNDNTGEIISLYENKYNITHVKLKEKVSLFESRKLAITKAKNDYIVFLDSDDLLEK